jgi:hypothetical protein
VIAAAIADDRAQSRRIHHQRAARCDHRSEPGGEAAEPAFERIAAGCVQKRNLDAGAAAVDLAQHGLEAEAVAAHVGLGPDLGIDRDHVTLARGLDAEAAEEHQGDRAGLHLAVEFVERPAHAFAAEIFPGIDLKSVTLQFGGDVAGVVDGLFERSLGVRIFRIADHQCDPVGPIFCGGGLPDGRGGKRQESDQSNAHFHNETGPDLRALSKLRLAPQRH